jgi:hypothetical protein
VRNLLKGGRYLRKPQIPEYYWGLIVRCWCSDPTRRPTFENLLEEFRNSHEYILEGSDLSKVLEYEDRIYSRIDSAKDEGTNE